MWEPFGEGARRAIVRAQQVAQMFGSGFIGTEHIAFALAEGDDEVGHLLANALDRDAIRERLGGVSEAPQREMVFTPEAKRAIELAFVNARRLNHNYIGIAHLALGLLGAGDPLAPGDPPPLLPGADVQALRAALDGVAGADKPVATGWRQIVGGEEQHPAAKAMLSALQHFKDLAPPGTRVSITIETPSEAAKTWTWTHAEQEG